MLMQSHVSAPGTPVPQHVDPVGQLPPQTPGLVTPHAADVHWQPVILVPAQEPPPLQVPSHVPEGVAPQGCVEELEDEETKRHEALHVALFE